ncbi:HNH endonuclease [Vibrio sp.]|uniref:HNH endonuclease n=1 Tax=Vibrio sp. TaxID=678 RepID=UPI003F6D6817
MRPVKRIEPLLNEHGAVKTFTSYQSARKDLISNFGGYCSYCEMRLDASLAVEHVKPKSLHEDLELEWSNFLLGCTNCNSIKTDKDPGLAVCTWPDKDNTALAFTYSEGGIVAVADGLTPAQSSIATETMSLVGLDRKVNTAKASDRRWINRREAWDKATRAYGRLEQLNHELMRQQIVENAVSDGYWSVWMTVFEDDTDMRQRFIDAVPGTANDCFDVHAAPISRPGGQI